MSEELEAEEAAEMLRIHIQNKYGGIPAFCEAHGISRSYVQRCVNGEVPLSDKLCKLLGLTKHRMIIHYYTRG